MQAARRRGPGVRPWASAHGRAQFRARRRGSRHRPGASPGRLPAEKISAACARSSPPSCKLPIFLPPRGWGGPSAPSLAQRGKLASQAIVHGVVVLLRQADEIPEAICILGIVLGRPDMVHHLGWLGTAIACRFPAAVPISPQRGLTQPAPAFVFPRIVKAHRQQKRAQAQCQHIGSGSKAQALDVQLWSACRDCRTAGTRSAPW